VFFLAKDSYKFVGIEIGNDTDSITKLRRAMTDMFIYSEFLFILYKIWCGGCTNDVVVDVGVTLPSREETNKEIHHKIPNAIRDTVVSIAVITHQIQI